MDAPMNRSRKHFWFPLLKKRIIALCILLTCTVVATTAGLASSPGRSSAATTPDLGSLPRLKNITQLGLFGPGGIAMTSPSVGWALGANNLQRTSNGGQSWQVVARAGATQVISPFFVLDDQTAWYMVTDTQTFTTTALVRTNDGGQSWTSFAWMSPTQFLNSISIFDQQFAWINTVDTSGPQPVFHLFLVGGSTPFQEVTLPSQDQVAEIHFISPRVGWVVTVNADGSTEQLHMTRDGGQSWITQVLPLPANVPATDAPSLQFLGFGNAQIGFLQAQFSDPTTGAIDGKQVYATSDGGQSWGIDGPLVPQNVSVISQIGIWHLTASFPDPATQVNLGTLSLGEWSVQSLTLPLSNADFEVTVFTNHLMFTSTMNADGTLQELFETHDDGTAWRQVGSVPFTV